MNIAFLQISNTQLLRTLLVLEVGHCTSATVKLTKLIASLHIYCTFSSNTIPPSGNGAAINVIKYKILGHILHVSLQFETIFQNCSFANNSLLCDNKDTFFGQQWIYFPWKGLLSSTATSPGAMTQPCHLWTATSF